MVAGWLATPSEIHSRIQQRFQNAASFHYIRRKIDTYMYNHVQNTGTGSVRLCSISVCCMGTPVPLPQTGRGSWSSLHLKGYRGRGECTNCSLYTTTSFHPSFFITPSLYLHPVHFLHLYDNFSSLTFSFPSSYLPLPLMHVTNHVCTEIPNSFVSVPSLPSTLQ